MAEKVEVVIKIPKYYLTHPQDYTCLAECVRRGVPLPKGHGDLIDKGKFKKWIETQDGDKLMTEYYLDALGMQETIVGGSHDGDID